MRVRNPGEPTTYLQARARGRGAKKIRSRGLTVYGTTPDRVMEIVEKALREAGEKSKIHAGAEPAMA